MPIGDRALDTTNSVCSSLKTIALVIAAGLGFAIALSRVTPAVAHADVRISTVDAWLSAHPAVANAMIWEFPPARSIQPIPKRFLVWAGPGIGPDPALYLPLADAVFPDRVLRSSVESPPTIRSSDSQLVSGGVETMALEGGWSVSSEPVPGNLPDWLPGGVKTSEYGAEIRSWPKWPEWAKAELRERFAAYRQWALTACALYADYAASGFALKPQGFDEAFSSMIDLDPAPVADPPANIQPDDPLVNGYPSAMAHSGPAFALYVRLVAAQLAIEISGCVPWSLVEYTAADLRPLFDGRYNFRYVQAGQSEWGSMTATGHVVTTTVTPAPPLKVLGFLAQNGLIGPDRTETVIRFLEWERSHLRHVIGGAPEVPLGNGLLYWGYNGRAPVSRMINGTVMAAPVFFPSGGSFFEPEIRHWVGGCGGASGFNQQVLRTLNITAHRTVYAHFQNRFALDGGAYAGIGHGDDPYALASAPEIPVGDILIDDATFHAWFVHESDPDVVLTNVGRRTANLYLAYLPQVLLQQHCWDLVLNNDHASSRVYNWAFSATYTVAELEALGLWTGIEAKLAALGGCNALQ
jgi:hypothetical protein